MTPSDRESCYAAFKSKDVRFDGLFFVGVSSTGICCRPVCRAKLPKIENCMFLLLQPKPSRQVFVPVCYVVRSLLPDVLSMAYIRLQRAVPRAYLKKTAALA